jgi:hypothetical protein
MIIEYNKMNKLIGNKDLARAMSGMVISGGYEGFLKIHDVILQKAKVCRAKNNDEGETKCYRMASALRSYYDSNC